MEDFVQMLAVPLGEVGIAIPRVIIFCKRYDECSTMYRLFRSYLGEQFVVPRGAPDVTKYRLVDMYTRCTEACVKEDILQSFCHPEGKLRVIIWALTVPMFVKLFTGDCPQMWSHMFKKLGVLAVMASYHALCSYMLKEIDGQHLMRWSSMQTTLQFVEESCCFKTLMVVMMLITLAHRVIVVMFAVVHVNVICVPVESHIFSMDLSCHSFHVNYV